jgi:PAS domain-containing protein
MAYTIGGFTFVILTATMLLSAYDARLSAAIASGAEKLRHANEQLERRVRDRTETLVREEGRKDAILRTALDCIISMDERGLIAEWNPAAEQTFGYRREEAIGRVLAELILGGHVTGQDIAPLSITRFQTGTLLQEPLTAHAGTFAG